MTAERGPSGTGHDTRSYMLFDRASGNAMSAYVSLADAQVALRQAVEGIHDCAETLVLIGYDAAGMPVGDSVTFADLPPVAVPGPASEQNVTEGMPPSLVRALRDPTIRLPQDDYKLADGRSLWEHLEEWRNAPSNTASGGPGPASVSPAEPHPAKLENAALTLAYRAEDVADHLMDNGLAPRVQLLRDAVLDLRYAVTTAREARRGR